MKTAFVTGASRGLGKGFVDYLLDQGYFVFAGVRDLKKDQMPNENLFYVVCDVSDDKSIDRCVASIESKTKTLDLIVNNAGVNKDSVTNGHKDYVCRLADLKRKYLLEMFNVNSISPLIIVQKFMKLLKPNPSFIINMSSCRASYHDEFENSGANYGYRASKAALNMFTFCSIKDLPRNVKMFSVHPGSVRTDMNPEGNQSPYKQAEKIISITEGWKDDFNGKFFRWDGNMYPL